MLENGVRVAVGDDDELTIGRAAGNSLRLEDPSVSRRHARVVTGPQGAWIEDIAATHGTYVDGVRLDGVASLRPGSQVQVGDLVLQVERAGGGAETEGFEEGGGHTVVVPVGASLMIPSIGEAHVEPAVEVSDGAVRPRLRSGHRFKQLGATDGGRWVVQDLENGIVVQLEDVDGALLPLLDGALTVPELVTAAEAKLGPLGPGRLARLLADLGERGLLAGIAGQEPPAPTGWRRWITPRELATRRLAGTFEAAYRRGGWVLFTRPALWVLGVVAVGGFAAELALIGFRYGSPLIVASHLGLGGLVFLLARALLVICHESAHGLALAAYGRRVGRAGLRLILIFPFVFVETTEAWFEPRRRRLTVTAAGPACDFVLGGALALGCLVLPAGTVRDILFQAAFAAYVGAFMNLNPFLDRDGYQLLVDATGRPQLRHRARAEFARRLSGRGASDTDPALRRFALAALGWAVVIGLAAVFISLQYADVARAYLPATLIDALLVTAWLVVFIPVMATLLPPLVARARGRGVA
ncbi:MAG: FHA domain-containing protein [Solirubrobacteraceae bacterium]|nr:FHA domain-containing protein [Solirubrobacteraceae bacterium]